ncbi:MAG: opacity family porin [Pasteurellaceae bacterium]|nr:opacity family porin [Pasteurellaceae bacterium]
MKKTLFFLTVLSASTISTMAVAENQSTSNKGFYVQGNLGLTNAVFMQSDKRSSETQTMRKLTPSINVGAGYDFGQIKVALDYTNYGKIKETSDVAGIQVKSTGLLGTYTFGTDSQFYPYVGAKLSSNQFRFSFDGETAKHRAIGFGLLGGVEYKLSQNLFFNAGLESNYLGSFNCPIDGDNYKVTAFSFGAKAGVRFAF